jgi:hypothetical protein
MGTNPDYPYMAFLPIDVLDILESKKIHSAYHTFFEEESGKKTEPTLYMHHNRNKPYHVDSVLHQIILN